jgi:hypothetical protein
MMTKALPFDNSDKMSEEEWLAFINSQAFFNFMNEIDKSVPLITQIVAKLNQLSLSALAKILMTISHFEEFTEVSLELAKAINQRIEQEVIQATNFTFTRPIILFDLCIGFVNLSTHHPKFGQWQSLLIKKLKESIFILSHSHKLIIIWKLCFFNSDYFGEFLPLLHEIAKNGKDAFNFFEKILLNQLLSYNPNPQDKHIPVETLDIAAKLTEKLREMTSESEFSERLKNYELENICREAMTPQDFNRVLANLKIHFEEESHSKVKFNQIVSSDHGQAFFVPIYIEGGNTCVLISNDGPGKDLRYLDIARNNAFGLGKAGFNVKYVSLSSLLDRIGDEDEIRLENIEKVRRELVRSILHSN